MPAGEASAAPHRQRRRPCPATVPSSQAAMMDEGGGDPALRRRLRLMPTRTLLAVAGAALLLLLAAPRASATPGASPAAGGRCWFGRPGTTTPSSAATAAGASRASTPTTPVGFWKRGAPTQQPPPQQQQNSTTNGSGVGSSSNNKGSRPSASSSSSWSAPGSNFWEDWFPLTFAKLADEWRFRVDSLEQYRAAVQARLDASLEAFQSRYQRMSEDVRRDVDKQLARAWGVHEDYLARIQEQQQRLAELTRTEIRLRQEGLSQSLEQFKRQYDEGWGKWYRDTVRKLGPLTKADMAKQQQRLDETFQQFMAQYSNSTAEVRAYIDRMVRFSGDVVPRLMEEDENVMGFIQRLREQEWQQLGSLGKTDLRRERARFEGLVENLRQQQEKLMGQFSSQRRELDASLKKLLEQLKGFNRLYDDLVARKESSLYAEAMNDKVLRRVLACLDETEADGWEFVGETHGVRVHRKNLPALDGRLTKFACVKATGVIDASPETILALFADNVRVPEYNKFYAEGRDLEAISESTKVVWAASPPMFFFKPRDFCTVVHYRKLQDGTVCVVNRGAEHPDAPRTDKYVRAEILMGANIIQPIKGKPGQTLFTIVTQVDPGGFSPPAIVNKVTSLGPPDFFQLVEKAAKRSPPPEALAAYAAQRREKEKKGKKGKGGA